LAANANNISGIGIASGTTATFTNLSATTLSGNITGNSQSITGLTALSSTNVDATNYADDVGNNWLTIANAGQPILANTLNANSHSIINVPTPVNPGDAANKSYVDSNKLVAVFGGTSTFPGTPYYAANGNTSVATGYASNNVNVNWIVGSTVTVTRLAWNITTTGGQCLIQHNYTTSVTTALSTASGTATLSTSIPCVAGDILALEVTVISPGVAMFWLYAD